MLTQLGPQGLNTAAHGANLRPSTRSILFFFLLETWLQKLWKMKWIKKRWGRVWTAPCSPGKIINTIKWSASLHWKGPWLVHRRRSILKTRIRGANLVDGTIKQTTKKNNNNNKRTLNGKKTNKQLNKNKTKATIFAPYVRAMCPIRKSSLLLVRFEICGSCQSLTACFWNGLNLKKNK